VVGFGEGVGSVHTKAVLETNRDAAGILVEVDEENFVLSAHDDHNVQDINSSETVVALFQTMLPLLAGRCVRVRVGVGAMEGGREGGVLWRCVVLTG
jgi:hypothetical protein